MRGDWRCMVTHRRVHKPINLYGEFNYLNSPLVRLTAGTTHASGTAQAYFNSTLVRLTDLITTDTMQNVIGAIKKKQEQFELMKTFLLNHAA